MYLRLFAHILVAMLISALYYDIGNDGAKVLSNLGFLFFNMLFLMYTSMTITILSCKWPVIRANHTYHFAIAKSNSHIISITYLFFICSPAGTTCAFERELQQMVLSQVILLSDYRFGFTVSGKIH